jgi:spore germination cell wall hydrolase CwlJ-like protein
MGFTSLLYEARYWVSAWRRVLTGRLADVREHLTFLAMFAVAGLAVAGIAYFAHLSATELEPARIQALQRETTRAQRRKEDLQCLAENVYFEARGEPLEGQYAVAEVTLNRTRARNFPHTICAVVHEARWDPARRRFVADFSWTELGALSPDEGAAWRQALAVASAEYDDLHQDLVPGALYYHATSIRPSWARARKPVARIGHHIFYL